jgi:putative DNA primase/helicase
MTPADAARDWLRREFLPVPVPFRSKKPAIERWQSLRMTTADVPRYFKGGPQNIGVRLGAPHGESDIDADCPEAITAAAILGPPTGLVFGRASKPASHRLYRCDPPLRSKKYSDPMDRTCLVELRGLKSNGGVGLQTIVPPSVHEQGEAIRFEPGFDREPANVDADVLAVAVARIAAAALLARHWPATGHGRHGCELALSGCLARAGWSREDAERFVLAAYGAVPDHDRGALGRVRAAVQDTFDKHSRGDEITGFATLTQAVGEVVAKCAMKWLGITAGHTTTPRPAAPADEPEESPPDLTGHLANDHGNACRLIDLYGRDMRYCHAFKKWQVWDGRRWAIDETDQARRLAKQAMLEALTQAVHRGCGEDAERFARGSLDARRIANLLAMAECELPITPAELDTNPRLLNFLNGTLDLATGQLREHRREDLITKLVHFNYRPEAGCPTFTAFLQRITDGGPSADDHQRGRAARLVPYLQKAFGYSLTGLTSEKVVFMPHGAGNNGKTTLLSTFLRVLDEYAVLLQIDTLMVRQESNNSQADLADLRGARFVMTSETEEGQRLAEGKLKRITQGMGRIKATRKYENPVEFQESHKLWMDANHRPVVRGTDNAIWNRLHPIPFAVVIPDEEIDRELPSKLMEEGEGILAWAVLGAVRWFNEGLGRPPQVESARQAWRDDMDQVGRFIEECCIAGESAQARGRQLYMAYRRWAGESGEHAIRENEFSPQLVNRGFAKDHDGKGTFYLGVGLMADGS